MLLRMLPSRFVEVEDTRIVHILQFGGIDQDEFSRRTVRVRQVDVPVLDHGSIRRIDDGVEELVFDLMEFGVAQAEALLRYLIVSFHQLSQHRSIRGLVHPTYSSEGQAKNPTDTPKSVPQVRPDDACQSR